MQRLNIVEADDNTAVVAKMIPILLLLAREAAIKKRCTQLLNRTKQMIYFTQIRDVHRTFFIRRQFIIERF